MASYQCGLPVPVACCLAVDQIQQNQTCESDNDDRVDDVHVFPFLLSPLYHNEPVLSSPIGENSRTSGKYSTLQEAVGARPSEHATPPCRGDTLGAGGAVADVTDEACCCHDRIVPDTP